MVPVMPTLYDSDLKTVKERSRSRLQSGHKFPPPPKKKKKNKTKKHENIMKIHSNIIIFLVIKEQAHSLGVPGF